MQLMRLAEVSTSQRDRVFRYSLVRALFAAFAVPCASGGLLLLGWHQRSRLAYYIAGVLLLGLVLMRRFILARFQPSNWLARMNDEGIFVQFRSYLNYHFPAEDLTVVFIPYPEIRSVRLVRQRRAILDWDETQTQQRRRLVEFELAGDSAPLAPALADESARRAPAEARWYGTTSPPAQRKWRLLSGCEACSSIRSRLAAATTISCCRLGCRGTGSVTGRRPPIGTG